MISSTRLRNSGRNAARTTRHHLILDGIGVLAFRLIDQEISAEIRRHDDQRVAEINGVALPVRQAAVVEHLQQHVEDIRMRFLDLVEKHDLVGPPPHRFGQRAALLIADITRWRADQASNRVLLHVFRHVDADQRVLVIEQIFSQSLGQLGLADTGWAQKHERADRPVRILQAGARASNCRRNRAHRVLLTDHALGKLVFHAKELFLFAFEHSVDRHAGPAGDDLRDVISGNGFLDHAAFAALGLGGLDGL